ncbi:unnamed protein product [Lactuca saligna]|uniref:Uncharacterized protein n=1 Tax=Lactuca saligna TaxID=75948 RepID=A0AA35ZJI2_LACSI|nr:unnamed protein product [Lactuca saligna]
MIFGNDDEDETLEGFTYNPFHIRTNSKDEPSVAKVQLQSLHEKIDQLLLASKTSSSEAYSKATVESVFERIMKEHSANAEKMTKAIVDSAEVCKITTEKVDKLIFETTTFMENFRTTFDSNSTKANESLQSLGSLFKTKKGIRMGLKSDHEAFQIAISSQLTKIQAELAMESKIMDSFPLKTERVKVLTINLEHVEKQVNDMIIERAVMKICISDITGLLSDIIETRDSTITISIRKHLHEKLRPVFAMLHKLEGVSDQCYVPKQGGEGGLVVSRKEEPKAPTKPIIKQEPKGKEKLFSEEPIIDDNEDEEELDEDKLKRKKGHEDELDENNRII